MAEAQASDREGVHSRKALYEEWKRAGPHLAEYGSECLGTLVLVFAVVGVVAVMMGPSSPVVRLLPFPYLRLLFAGLMLGGTGWLIALSPPGRLSGAHVNPAVSLGFWLLGKMHGRDIAGYVAGQMLGGVVGALLGYLAFSRLAREIHDAALRPTVSRPAAFLLECLTTFALTSVIYAFVSRKRLMRWTPCAGMVMTGILVCLDGDLSGAGMNPARWFGPALTIHFWADSGIYILGPLLGAVLAAGLRRLLPFRYLAPHTGKLFHDPHYRSVFRNDHVPSAPPPPAQAKRTP